MAPENVSYDNTAMIDQFLAPNTLDYKYINGVDFTACNINAAYLNQARPVSPVATATAPRYNCSHCMRSFKRDSDRIRHENATHLGQVYLCPVAGCVKSQGQGYSRPDKVTEHLWKKHGNLGFVKRT